MKAKKRLEARAASTHVDVKTDLTWTFAAALILCGMPATLHAEDAVRVPSAVLNPANAQQARSDADAIWEKPPAIRFAVEPTTGHAVPAGKLRMLGFEPAGIKETIAAYRAGHLDAGDLLAANIEDPLARTTLEIVALRSATQAIGFDRFQAFATNHPDWPAMAWVRHQMEARLVYVRDPLVVERFFTAAAPETAPGKLALAKALAATGRTADATKLARALFRETDLPPYLADGLKKSFGADLTRGDYKYRADRLFYRERASSALAYAAKAGQDVLALARARVASIRGASRNQAMDAVPEAWRSDPGLILAQVQKLRHHKKPLEAAHLLRTIAPEGLLAADGDRWWNERRSLARDLLDVGKINAAYITCALHGPASRESEVDAEFHAGWIALRFMHDPSRATYHFWAASKRATTPNSIARIAYWQGRTAEAIDDPAVKSSAPAFYEKAALHVSTYYGQLARQALGLSIDVAPPSPPAAGAERAEAVRVIELLYAADEKALASMLAAEVAAALTDPEQVAALAAVIAKQEDAHLALTIGKIFGQRGISADAIAFPTYGIPPYKEVENSAPPSIVYSVARQESAFLPRAVSGAGAKGLMQMIVPTARTTARHAGLSFTPGRLLHDAAFNAQLGAAHLGALMSQNRGSLILTFVAYNAGPGRVQDWIEAYGDPREPGVDPVDWVERIPFNETRAYVQKVMANVAIYSAIFAGQAKDKLMARAAGEAKL